MAHMHIAYEDLGETEQVALLRPVALRAAAAFGIEVAGMDLLLHGYNTTFALRAADGRSFALRIATNSHSTAGHAIAQQAWIAAIAQETDVLVAPPLRGPDGRWFVEVDAPPVGRALLGQTLLVTVAGWLDGADADPLEPAAARALGRAMATLHAHGETWQLPSGGVLPSFDEPLFGDRDLLDLAPGLLDEGRALLRLARRRTSDAFDRAADSAPVRPLHADLHGGNVKWHAGRLAVFDFDDAGVGPPVLDLAISTFYLRGEDPQLEAAMRAGYAEVAPLPDVDPSDFEALVAARQLLLLNALQLTSTAPLRTQAAEYLDTSIARLRRWLDTGIFTRALD